MPAQLERIDGTIPARRCSRCGELWPATSDFWYRCPRRADGLHSWCRACTAEAKEAQRKGKPVEEIYPGTFSED